MQNTATRLQIVSRFTAFLQIEFTCCCCICLHFMRLFYRSSVIRRVISGKKLSCSAGFVLLLLASGRWLASGQRCHASNAEPSRLGRLERASANNPRHASTDRTRPPTCLISSRFASSQPALTGASAPTSHFCSKFAKVAAELERSALVFARLV